MISQEEAKDFIRRYREVILETPLERFTCAAAKRFMRSSSDKENLLLVPLNSSIYKKPRRMALLRPL